MGVWGWRQAAWVAFISVLVVACTQTAPVTPPNPTATPRPITLTLQGSPGAPPITARPTLVTVAATPADEDPAQIDIQPPVCIETVSDGYQCIGVARNSTDSTQGTVLLYAELYDGDEIVQTRSIALEMRVLAPDAESPYRILFDKNAAGPLVLTLKESFAPDKQLVMLDLDEDSVVMDCADYTLTGALVNPHNFPVNHIRVVVGLYSGADLFGYRVAEFEKLGAGGRTTLNLHWYNVPCGDYRYTFAADAIIAP